MRHTLLDLGYRPNKIQSCVNNLREDGMRRWGITLVFNVVVLLSAMAASLSEVELVWVEVAVGCCFAGRTLADLDLRARTGANAVVLRRGGETRLFLDATTEIHEGDKLGLVGADEDIERGAQPSGACGGLGRGRYVGCILRRRNAPLGQESSQAGRRSAVVERGSR